MKKFLAATTLCLALGTSACANTETRTLQGLYTLDETFAIAQTVAISLIDSKALEPSQIAWVKTTDHFIAEELKALTQKAIDKENGQPITLSATDVAKVKADIATFKAGMDVLKGEKK